MPVFSVEGKLGTGKTKFCVWRAQEAITAGRRVASNVDIAAHLLNPSKPGKIIRVPDKPTSADLIAMGHGNPESYDEEKNGVLILDELGTWLNSRSFQDKERAGLLDWLIHARKHGWDVYLIVQDAGMIDKQVREALIEYQVKCMRMDKVKIPLIGWFLGSIVTRWAYLPKFHLATARVGQGVNAIVAERWQFVGTNLHAAYDTRQIFRSDYEHGTFSALPPWDYAVKPRQSLIKKIFAVVFTAPTKKPTPKAKHPMIALVQKLPPERRISFIKKHGLSAFS